MEEDKRQEDNKPQADENQLQDNGNTAQDSSQPAASRSVDEEWAEVLKINYDESRLRTTPPPVPGADTRPPAIPREEPQPAATTQWSPYMGDDGNRINPLEYGSGGNDERREVPPMPSTYLVWSIVMTVLCCFIPGIVAIIFSSQVSSRYYTGDYEGAQRASNRAQIWIIVSFVLGVLSASLYLPIMLIS